jgi:hypothetical protein
MREITQGDRLEDSEGNVWTVAEVIEDSPSPRYQVRLERLQPVEKWAGLDEIGLHNRRYKPLKDVQ